MEAPQVVYYAELWLPVTGNGHWATHRCSFVDQTCRDEPYLVDELGDKDDGGDDTGDEADGPDHDVERRQRHPFVAAPIYSLNFTTTTKNNNNKPTIET